MLLDALAGEIFVFIRDVGIDEKAYNIVYNFVQYLWVLCRKSLENMRNICLHSDKTPRYIGMTIGSKKLF